MEKNDKLTRDQELQILMYFETHEDNRDQTIADHFELNKSQVGDYLNNHFKRKQQRIAERKFRDIDWGPDL